MSKALALGGRQQVGGIGRYFARSFHSPSDVGNKTQYNLIYRIYLYIRLRIDSADDVPDEMITVQLVRRPRLLAVTNTIGKCGRRISRAFTTRDTYRNRSVSRPVWRSTSIRKSFIIRTRWQRDDVVRSTWFARTLCMPRESRSNSHFIISHGHQTNSKDRTYLGGDVEN